MSSTIIQSSLKIAVDEASSTVTYIGWTAPNTATSVAGWRIMRITISGTVTLSEFANGNNRFANIWDNRASLTYS